MKKKPNRRDFNKLTAAAFGGLVTGTITGCGGAGDGGGSGDSATTQAAAKEIHVCRGLNSCQGQGAGGKNACAGQGSCATAEPHSCGGQNACKNQGGCGQDPGQNACKGQGGCGVPMQGDMWQTAREKFEQRMKEAGKTFGEAPVS